ncbi:MAG: SRPBCC domain-containing protein [Chromatiales bacterium]|nr:SRPBCC domain-containing protein [Chromatiales bacterium]
MEKTNFTHEVTVAASAQQAFTALSRDLGIWWGNTHEGVTQVGDTLVIGFEENPEQWAFEALELVEAKRVVLKCIAMEHRNGGFPGIVQDEWLDSLLIWDISEEAAGTKVAFTHQGLTQGLTCYDVCHSAWESYLNDTFVEYLRLN